MCKKELESICKKVACNLITMYPSDYSNMLIFPKLRGTLKVRISEQEARFSFASEIEKLKKYYYAVEVPTVNRYSDFSTNPKVYNMSTKGGRSGSIDLSLYEKDERDAPLVNIEFKSGQPKLTSITKDILKLLYEPCANSIFFHILEHTNPGTLESLIQKFNKSITKIRARSIKFPKIEFPEILFFIVILENDKSKSRYVSYCFDFSKNTEIVKKDFSHFSFCKDLDDVL